MRARGEADPPARYRTALVSPVLSVLVLLVLAARRPERRAGDMPSVYGQKYVWSVEDAEGPSHDRDREGTSGARLDPQETSGARHLLRRHDGAHDAA